MAAVDCFFDPTASKRMLQFLRSRIRRLGGREAGTDLKQVKLIEGWYAKGEDGGYFAALQQNFYKDKGIDMTIQPGGPEVSTMQLVVAGKAEFGISYADEILKAREQGIPVVGILAGFQSTPQVLMYHKGRTFRISQT